MAAAAGGAALGARLSAACERDQHERVAALAAEALEGGGEDGGALAEAAAAVRVTSLILQEKYDAALACDPPPNAFQRAYCLYRKGEQEAALAVLEDAGTEDADVCRLRAQTLYRLGRASEALAELQPQVTTARGAPDAAEIVTNALACAAAAAAAADGSKAADTGSEGAIEAMLDATGVEPRDSFEVAYNVACAALACGDVARAEEMLNLALKVGRAALELDDAGEDEISEELAPAEVQLAYIAQLGGGAEEAAKAYTSVLDGGADAVTTAVAANNLAAARGKHEVFDSLKRFAGLFGPKKSASEANAIVASLDTRLGPAQRRALMRTRALLLLHAGKSELAGRAADAYGSAFPDDAAAAILAASRPGVSPGVADDMLSSYAGGQRGPAAAAAAHCARAELAARAGLLEEAAAALEAVAELIKLTPPVVATLLDVYGRLDDAERSAATLERALSPGGGGGDMALPAELLRGAAERRQVEGRHAEAAELWQRCEARAARGDEGDDTLARLARAGAVECLASSGQVGAAEELASGLAPVPGAEKLNPEALLSAPVRERADAGKVGSTAVEGGESAGGSGEAEQPRKRRVMSERRKERKRLRRLPKGFDPANPGPPPDPERWLPKRERSAFRRKRNKKVTGGQGAVNVESMGKLDAATQEAAKTQQAPSRGSGKKGRKQKGGRR